MFDLGSSEDNNIDDIKYTFNIQDEFTDKELLSMEKEMIGIYLLGHPLEKLREQIELQTNINSIQIKQIDEQMQNEEIVSTNLQYKDGQSVKCVGIITSIKKKYTKTNKIMAFVTVEDLYGSIELIVFENAYLSAQNSLVEENIVLIDGRLSIREDEETKIIAREITDFGIKKQKVLNLDITEIDEQKKKKLRGLIKYFAGDKNNMAVQVQENEEIKPCGAIYLTEDIMKIFEQIIGKERVTLKEYN